MKRQLVCTLFLLMVLLPVATEAAVARNLNPREAFAMFGQRSDLYLLDVRTRGCATDSDRSADPENRRTPQG
jgi:hypothetical protein